MSKQEFIDFQKEEWKDVFGYVGLYQVSNLGNVKSLDRIVNCKGGKTRTSKGVTLKPRLNPEGRFYVSLSKNGKVSTKKIHKLVAIAFLGHVPNGYKEVVDHINNIHTDNRATNLQLITQRLNVSKDRKNKSSKYTGVWFCNLTNKFKSEIRINGVRYNLGSFNCELDAKKSYDNKLNEMTLKN